MENIRTSSRTQFEHRADHYLRLREAGSPQLQSLADGFLHSLDFAFIVLWNLRLRVLPALYWPLPLVVLFAGFPFAILVGLYSLASRFGTFPHPNLYNALMYHFGFGAIYAAVLAYARPRLKLPAWGQL